MTVGESGLSIWRYWDPSALPPLEFGSMRECEEAFLDRLRTAVHCRLRSTGPIGSALSGGLDSSSIVGLIRSEFRNELAQLDPMAMSPLEALNKLFELHKKATE